MVISLAWYLVRRITQCYTGEVIKFIVLWIDNLMLQVVQPRIWFPAMQIVWGVLTFWLVYRRIIFIPSTNRLLAQAPCRVFSRWTRFNCFNSNASTLELIYIKKIWGIRFLQGIAESSTFVGTHYVLGSWVHIILCSEFHILRSTSWYKPAELGKRSGIFTSSGLAGTL